MRLILNKPVSGVQFDIVTTGNIFTPLIEDVQVGSLNTDTDTYTVLAFISPNTTFTGEFMYVNGNITQITNIIGSDADGNLIEDVGISVSAEASTLLKFKVA